MTEYNLKLNIVTMNAREHKVDIGEESLRPTTSMSVQPSHSPRFDPNGDSPPSGLDPILLVMISLILSSTIALLMGTLTWAYRRKNRPETSHFQKAHRRPCQGCQYFYPNTSLKCAVHPSTVMTEASDDCRDYWPNRKSQSVKR
jgi:hypothetical protein